MAIRIVFPEPAVVPDSKIAMWYADAVANDEIDEEYLGRTDPVEQAHALSDAGIITWVAYVQEDPEYAVKRRA